MQTDVLISGAGPTGLALACQLIRYGVDFVIIDKKETTTPYSKAIGVQARTLEIYEQIGLADKLIALGAKAEGAKIFVGGKLRGEIDFRDIGAGLSPYPFALIVEQGKHETLLYDYIKSHGRDVLWQSELTGFTQDSSGVSATVVKPGGESEAITAKYLIGCDGAKSMVRHDLGMTFSGSTFERLFYVADVEVDWDFTHDGLQVFLMKNALLAAFPMVGERHFRFVGTFPQEFEKDEGEVLYEEIEARIRRDAEIDFDITKVHWFSTYKVHTRHVDKFSDGRCFLAGDAAHIHSPAGAQGMNTGIQDGYNLSWKLALVLRGHANEKLLDTYNEERLPNAVNLTRTTDRFFGLIAHPNPLLAFVRTKIFPYFAKILSSTKAIRQFVFPRVSQIAINYRGMSLSQDTGNFKIKAGDRMPWFKIDGVSIYDGLREPLFHLIVFLDGKTDVPPLPDDLLQAWRGQIDSHVFTINERISDIFGHRSAFYLILRPDNYIGLIADDFSTEAVRE